MGKQLVVFICTLLFLIIFLTPINCDAANFKEEYFNKLHLTESSDLSIEENIYKSKSRTEKSCIINLDVSDSGKLLICFENNTINIYDCEGVFDFSLNYIAISGGSIAFWYNENIVVYLFRENTFVFFNENGNVDKTYKFYDDVSKLIKNVKSIEEIDSEKFNYILKKSGLFFRLLSDNYNEVIQINNNSNNEKVIYSYYEVENELLEECVYTLIMICGIIGCFVYIFKKKRKN